MGHRILSIVRAHLAGEWFGKGGVNLPIAPLFFHACPALVLCAIARSELSLFGYGVFALSIPLALTTLPLLGELGPLLRADAAAEWIALGASIVGGCCRTGTDEIADLRRLADA